MKILITGANGFVARNLSVRLKEIGHDILAIDRASSQSDWEESTRTADFVFHLAGVNRPSNEDEFTDNATLTARLCDLLCSEQNCASIVFSSSIQVDRDNSYGLSKRAAEDRLMQHAASTAANVAIFRLPNVFGKWARPDYNSAVATFCHRIGRGLPIEIHDPDAPLPLVYIDDVVDRFLAMVATEFESGLHRVEPEYQTTVGNLAETIEGFARSRATLLTDRVGCGLTRALYATYLSYLPADLFSYTLATHEDARGRFVEMLKTQDSGQFSFFTAVPGVTRGDHYHHSKVEKFLVVAGKAHFAFRHIVTGDRHELVVSSEEARVVETIPGWTHNITNCGETELLVMLWANEIFDRHRPDTIAMKV